MMPAAPPPLMRSSLYVMIVALLMIIMGLGVSAYFFSGFLGGGRSAMGVFQAFLLCFGIGSLVYLPAVIVFFMARHVRGLGPKRAIGMAAVLISLPWWTLGGTSLIMRLPYWPYGLVAMVLGLGLLFWALKVLRAIT